MTVAVRPAKAGLNERERFVPLDIAADRCKGCGLCVDTCPKHGALELRLTIPGLAPQRPAREQQEGVR